MPKGKTPRTESLLIEFLTEELPPKSLKRLAATFADAVNDYLKDRHFLEPESTFQHFATPRRLAVRVLHVRPVQPDRTVERKGPSVQTGLDTSGRPTQALLGFARSCGVAPEKLERYKDDKGEYFLFSTKQKGETLAKHITPIIADALKRLPVAKLMRWGENDAQFVRPVHGLVLLHGSRIIPGEVLRLKSGNKTLGHRFLSRGWITIKRAADYEQTLHTQGKVVVSFEKRRESISDELAKRSAALKSSLGLEADYSPLLDEVTALVEQPAVYAGEFEQEFLTVPQECLISTLRKNQKYFPLFDKAGKLINKFLIVSNMRLDNPKNIVEGNQRVVRPRLADARFFFETDKKTKLVDRVPQLASIVYHNKLGSQLDRVERVRKLAAIIAELIGTDAKLADRAAFLAKADLVTNMVGEFPELQGIMGRYYALADGEDSRVAEAIGDQYRIRFDEYESPSNLISMSLFIADRVETLIGIWGIGLQPTGDKDPFGLRRAALGVISAFELLGATANIEGKRLIPRLEELIEPASALFKQSSKINNVGPAIIEFVYERYRNQLAISFDRSAVDAVIALRPPLHEVVSRIRAVTKFGALPEAASLAAANKRIRNILSKSPPPSGDLFSENKLVDDAEISLYNAYKTVETTSEQYVAKNQFAEALVALAELKQPVDEFFNSVMVNVEDVDLRNNRLLLLMHLDGVMNQVADISKLAVEK
jgi:glycyl-tRNA synthetase beta chain